MCAISWPCFWVPRTQMGSDQPWDTGVVWINRRRKLIYLSNWISERYELKVVVFHLNVCCQSARTESVVNYLLVGSLVHNQALHRVSKTINSSKYGTHSARRKKKVTLYIRMRLFIWRPIWLKLLNTRNYSWWPDIKKGWSHLVHTERTKSNAFDKAKMSPRS